MKPTEHPLQKALEARVRLLETTLQPSTVKQYRRTVRLFLGYLSQNFPEVHRPSHLQKALEARVRLLETTLQPSTVKQYRRTVRLFLGYLSQNFPEVHRPSQLQIGRASCRE